MTLTARGSRMAAHASPVDGRCDGNLPEQSGRISIAASDGCPSGSPPTDPGSAWWTAEPANVAAAAAAYSTTPIPARDAIVPG